MVELHQLCCFQWVRSGWGSVAFALLLPGVSHITDGRYFGRLDLLSRHVYRHVYKDK
jgi:hypothetical protein